MAKFKLNETIKPHMFNYGESLGFELPTLSSEFNGIETDFDSGELKETIEALPKSAFKLFDNSLLSICGWHFGTLKDLALSRTSSWIQILEDEINSDDDDPFQQTGYIMDLWNDANESDSDAVDAIFMTLFGEALSSRLITIQNGILAEIK
ncbi:MAG: hypothetical protein CL840_00495 [Crocinitomicaceae bacterium]|nr:hypothetical protein [Crocinitomicaceae bacterium]|tara:strand:+ start:165965 stop:166417 length:453 start_codon:yes stop_codon:yes gene_type:complete